MRHVRSESAQEQRIALCKSYEEEEEEELGVWYSWRAVAG